MNIEDLDKSIEFIFYSAAFESVDPELLTEVAEHCDICRKGPPHFTYGVDDASSNQTAVDFRRKFCCVNCACEILRNIDKKIEERWAICEQL